MAEVAYFEGEGHYHKKKSIVLFVSWLTVLRRGRVIKRETNFHFIKPQTVDAVHFALVYKFTYFLQWFLGLKLLFY